jgi:hypothetical protein
VIGWRATAVAAGLACGLGVPNTAAPDSATSYWFARPPNPPDSTEAFPLVVVRAGVISPCDKSCLRAARKGAHIRSVRIDGGVGGDNRVTGLLRASAEPSREIVAVKEIGESWWHLVLHYKMDGETGGGWRVVATVPGSTV